METEILNLLRRKERITGEDLDRCHNPFSVCGNKSFNNKSSLLEDILDRFIRTEKERMRTRSLSTVRITCLANLEKGTTPCNTRSEIKLKEGEKR